MKNLNYRNNIKPTTNKEEYSNILKMRYDYGRIISAYEFNETNNEIKT